LVLFRGGGGGLGGATYWQGNGPLPQPTQQSSHPPSALEWRTAAIGSELAVPAVYNVTHIAHDTRAIAIGELRRTGQRGRTLIMEKT
jgi:hypothetical protein